VFNNIRYCGAKNNGAGFSGNYELTEFELPGHSDPADQSIGRQESPVSEPNEQPIRLFFMRHLQSEGNVDESAYIKKGDHAVGGTKLGWQQAIKAGKFLGPYLRKLGIKDWSEITTYISSYQRPKDTLTGVLHGMDGALAGMPKLYEDPRLIEKFFGATNHINHPELVMDPSDPRFPEFKEQCDALKLLSSEVYAKDPFASRNLLGESTKDTLLNVKSFLDGTFMRDRAEGKKNFLFVTHGAVIQALLKSWKHLKMDAKVPNPGNCDIICIEGTPKNWTVRRIYNGEKMIAVDEPFIDHLEPFNVDDLPPVPDGLSLSQ
jgi:2,3-bisphosphoglycerate-dependent phosphoglycerate mutase